MTLVPQLAYEAALRGLDDQRGEVEALVQRTAALLAASSLTASFLGGEAILRARGIAAGHVVAILALVVSTSVAVYLLGPKPSLTGMLKPSRLAHEMESLDDDAVLLRLALSLERLHERNAATVNAMQSLLRLVALGLLVQLLAWTLSLVGTLA